MKKTALAIALILALGMTGCNNSDNKNEPEEAPATEITAEEAPAAEVTTEAAPAEDTPAPETEAAAVTEPEKEYVITDGVDTSALNIIKEYDAPAIGEEAIKALTEWREKNGFTLESANYCIIGDYTVFSDCAWGEMALSLAIAQNGRVTEIGGDNFKCITYYPMYFIRDGVLYYYDYGLSSGIVHIYFVEFSLADGSKINEYYDCYSLGSDERYEDLYINTYDGIENPKDLEAYVYSISMEWYRTHGSDVLYADIK